jgi:signal peptidase I
VIAGYLGAGAVVVVCLAVTVVRRRLFVVTVHGTSMEPTFRPGDRVLARRVELGSVRVGDVVIVGARVQGAALDVPDTPWIIKRLAAIPGDPVPRDRFAALAQVRESAVPAGKLVVLGDSPRSADSRMHGYYDGNQLAGVVVRKLR